MDSIFLTKDPTGQKFLEYLKPHPCYAGLDLASVSDLTAFVLAWPIKDVVYTFPWFFIPGEELPARCRQDSVPYDQWLKAGHIEVTQGNVTDWRYVCRRIKELSTVFKIHDIGFDRAGARDIVSDLTDEGIVCTDVSQAMMSLTAPAKRLQELILSTKLVHTGNPILRWNLDCASIYGDSNGNIKVLKPDIGKSSKRIDGIIALIIAMERLQKAPTQQKSIYSQRGLLKL
jgi:phage terminase large subunit-like protein